MAPEASGRGPEEKTLALLEAAASSRVAAAFIPEAEIDDVDEMDIAAAPEARWLITIGGRC